MLTIASFKNLLQLQHARKNVLNILIYKTNRVEHFLMTIFHMLVMKIYVVEMLTH